ncbi:MAG: hypothetical protein IPF83_02240 [Rhodanobacteraceae bacterium]|nr:hypothetical protein [Rhodanobacteraceae bacterium]
MIDDYGATFSPSAIGYSLPARAARFEHAGAGRPAYAVHGGPELTSVEVPKGSRQGITWTSSSARRQNAYIDRFNWHVPLREVADANLLLATPRPGACRQHGGSRPACGFASAIGHLPREPALKQQFGSNGTQSTDHDNATAANALSSDNSMNVKKP